MIHLVWQLQAIKLKVGNCFDENTVIVEMLHNNQMRTENGGKIMTHEMHTQRNNFHETKMLVLRK